VHYDFNRDGYVTMADLSLMLPNWNQHGACLSLSKGEGEKGGLESPCHCGKIPDQLESRTIFLLRKPGCMAIVKISRQRFWFACHKVHPR
jgi:hypothetical protein